MKLTKKLILASGSPRRAQLLEELLLPHEVRVTAVEEILPQGYPALDAAAYLSALKAEACLRQNSSGLREVAADEVILTSDTVVLLGEQLLGKPADLAEAKVMLLRLAGNTHVVVTGVTLSWMNAQQELRQDTFAVRSEVSLATMTAAEVDFSLAEQPPLDKAGSYGVQDWLGRAKVARIEGSYTNIMGLPTAEVYAALVRHDLLRV